MKGHDYGLQDANTHYDGSVYGECFYLSGNALAGAVVKQKLHHIQVILLRRHVERSEAILEKKQKQQIGFRTVSI